MNKILFFLSCYIASFLIAKFSQYIVKNFYQRPNYLSLKNIFHTISIFSVTLLFYAILTTAKTPFLYAYILYVTLISITIFTDMYAMLIAPLFTLYCVPLGWIITFFNFLPITCNQSLIGTLFAFMICQSMYYLFLKIMKQEALGKGDLDFLVFIASWTGFQNFWFTLSLGSYLASIYGIAYWSFHKTKNFKLPFGTFLGFASLILLTYNNQINNLFNFF